ncbi:MAG: winged helix-turn-helix transcriptional regulator [Robiginitomaculum sp.]|nr:winged helix-turn-helix transcriptional regulator [Robiginitomaculum sp.]
MNHTFKALAHPVRRQILKLLRDGPMTSGALLEPFDMAWPSLTAHLKTLKNAGLIHGERHGTEIRYRLNAGAAEDAIAAVMAIFSNDTKSAE